VRYPKPTDEISFQDRLHDRLLALPGVDSVATVSSLPTFGSISYPYELEGQETDDAHRPSLSALQISPDYFRVMGVGILQGRAFADQDGIQGGPVVIVNQQFATKYWPGQDAIGKRLRLFGAQEGITVASTSNDWLTVVGIVPNIVQNENSPTRIDPLIYLPFHQSPGPQAWVLARTHVPPDTLATPVRRELQALDGGLPVALLQSVQETLARDSWFYRLISAMFAIFAGVALLLASVGLYALMANSVGQRTQEFGVRIAMGADSSNIHRLVFRQGLRQMAIGLLIGLAVTFVLTRLLQSSLVAVSSADPVTFIVASAMLILAAALGCFFPARRATRVDPMVALRYE
jgi:putative ABC transport system permease protein